MTREGPQSPAFDLRQAMPSLETFLVIGGFIAYLYWRSPGYWGDGEVRGNAIIELVEKEKFPRSSVLYSRTRSPQCPDADSC